MRLPSLVCQPLLLSIWGMSSAFAGAQIEFTDVSATVGIGAHSMPAMGGGIAAADFDEDGDIDVFVPNAEGTADQLYQNLGNGQFAEVAVSAGLASMAASRAGLWFDYDGDHKLDLVVAGDCFAVAGDCVNGGLDGEVFLTLYRQTAPGVFTDVTTAVGLPTVVNGEHFGGMCAGDVNNDGYLDLVFVTWLGSERLFLNNTDGTFTTGSVSSGTTLSIGDFWQPIMYDFNGDGWQDIYMAVDFAPNRMMINQKDGTFLDVASATGTANDMNDMGVALGDFDNDQDLDIYVTNVFQALASRSDGDSPSMARGFGRNVLLRNDSTETSLSFSEVSATAGVDNGYWGWGTTFMDSHNDTLLDIVATNGFGTLPWTIDPSRFFLNQGDDPRTFADLSSAIGFDDTDWGSGLISFDFDRDGDLDLMQSCVEGGPVRLLQNSPIGMSPNGFLVIKPRMDGPNHWSIGATVHVSVGGITMMRLITAGTSFMSQEPAEAFFGIGQAAVVDAVTINWPDGSNTVMTDVPANQVLTVTPESAIPTAGQWANVAMAVVLITTGALLFRSRLVLGACPK